MNTNHDPMLDVLHEANPVPADRAAALFPAREPRRNWKIIAVAATSVLLLSLGGFALPSLLSPNAPTASAQEVLDQAAASSATQFSLVDAGLTASRYFARSDSDGQGTVHTTFDANDAGWLSAHTDIEGTPGDTLAAFAADPLLHLLPGDAVVQAASTDDLLALIDGQDQTAGLLSLLLHPVLSNTQQERIYSLLAKEEGTVVSNIHPSPTGGEDEVVDMRHGDLSFSLIPTTGQLTSVTGLLGPGITTTVAATAIVDCVHIAGFNGPEEIVTACADGNYKITNIQWQNWNAPEATGRGTARINNCDPTCAEGHFEDFPVTVKVSSVTECGYQARIYSKLDVYFDDPSQNTSYDFGCIDPS